MAENQTQNSLTVKVEKEEATLQFCLSAFLQSDTGVHWGTAQSHRGSL